MRFVLLDLIQYPVSSLKKRKKTSAKNQKILT